MRGEAVPQRVWRDALLDPRGLGGGMDGTTELAGRQRFDRVAAGKQPASRQQQAPPPPFPPPDPQQFEQLWRQHCNAGLSPPSPLPADHTPLALRDAPLVSVNPRS